MKKRVLLMSVMALLLAPLSVWAFDQQAYIQQTKKDILDAQSKKDFLIKYCKNILQINPFEIKKYKIDSTRSFFVYNLCNLVKKDIPGFEDKFSQLKTFTKSTYVPLDENCYPDKFNNNCKLAWESASSFNLIMNELFTIKELNIFGVGKADTHEAIMDFSKKYFPIKDCDEEGSFFLDKSGPKPICEHPLTYSFLKATINSLKDNLDQLVYLDGKKILKTTSDELFKKAFAQSSNVSDMDVFRNILWNEFFFFKLWMVGYKQALLNNHKLLPPLLPSDWAGRQRETQKEIATITSQIYYSQIAIDDGLRFLKDAYLTFPIHVGMKVYLEDLYKLRDKLVRMYTPLNQLYYKIQNVQNIQR